MVAEKYYHGKYAICKACSSRPCVCSEPPPSAAAPLQLRQAPKSGNAIPFIVWDALIAHYELSIIESGVLLYLCRITFGYGLPAGAPASIRQVAAALRISPRSSARALRRLELGGLIERDRSLESDRAEYARTHIRVILDPEEVMTHRHNPVDK